MKGRIMDVLNLSNQRSSKSSTLKDVIKIETDDEREKENCENDLVNDTRNKEMDVDLESVKAQMSDDDVEMEEDDDDYEEEEEEEEEDTIPNLPILSVIIKEDDNVLNYNDDVPLSRTRPEVEIKYEDDIEEEDYDSEESVNIREMPPLRGRPGVESPDRSQPNRQANSFLSALNSSMLNPNAVKQIFNGSRGGTELNGSVSGASDSVILPIVYATINVPFSQVSKFLQAYHLSKSDLSIIRKVRRQVKNRLYAQNCRRRRIAHINNLSNELRQVRSKKVQMCNLRRELLAKKVDVEKRYSVLYDHVMNVVRERCRNTNVDSPIYDSDEEESVERYHQLKDERVQLEEQRNRLETEYHNLHTRVFKIISERQTDSGSDSCLANSSVQDRFNVQLRNMNIVNELAILNQFYTKNNNQDSSRESVDVDSSGVSVDGSRTSENKMSDFVDYESGASVDGSCRTEENTRDDLVECKFNTKCEGREEGVAEASTATTFAVAKDGTRKIGDVRLGVGEEKEGEEDLENLSDDEDEGSDNDDDEESGLDELKRIKESLELRKNNLHRKYTKLYDHVVKKTLMNEVEFLKTFTDYCITSLLETLRKT